MNFGRHRISAGALALLVGTVAPVDAAQLGEPDAVVEHAAALGQDQTSGQGYEPAGGVCKGAGVGNVSGH